MRGGFAVMLMLLLLVLATSCDDQVAEPQSDGVTDPRHDPHVGHGVDGVGDLDADLGACLARVPGENKAPRHEDYPTLRVHDRLATIGLCSAIPTPIFRAGGWLGESQLDRLERLLNVLRDRKFCRVVMIHHPVAEKGEPTRRALWDGEALRQVLARAGAELVIHGHKHRRRLATLAHRQLVQTFGRAIRRCQHRTSTALR